MLTAARLTFRLYRFELIMILAYGLLLAALALIVTARLNSINPGVDCLKAWLSQGPPAAAGCETTSDFLGRNEEEAGKVMAAMWLLPLVAGVVAGSVLVAREIEHRTAQFAWSIGPSRGRWYLDRLIPVMVVAVGAVVLASITAEVLEAARMPWFDAVASASDFGLRGPIVIALAFAALGVAVLVGSVVGRMLPALIIAAVLAVAIRSVVSGLTPYGEPLVALDESALGSGLDYPLMIDQAYRAADGRILTTGEAIAQVPSGTADPYTWLGENFTTVALGVAARNVWRVELRESAILLVIGAVGLTGAWFVVSRRRPY